jgi:general secretion pathway protein L
MRIGAIFGRWIDVLAGVLFAGREAWRARHVLIVARENDRLVVRQAEPNRDVIIGPAESELNFVLAVLSAGAPVSIDVARAARKALVVLELPADAVVTRRITVPAQAREFLPGIVRNQIERLSPWQADQAVYGFDAEVSKADAATLDVRVLVTSRAVVDQARDELAAIDLPLDRIVARAEGDNTIVLWSRLADASPESRERARRRIALGVAASVGVSLALCLWAIASTASIRAESEDAAARAKTLQRRIEASRTPQDIASLKPPERAWALKESSPSAVVVLEALSRTLPDAAYLTELHLDSTTLRIIGLAGDAPSLIAPLERSGYLANVHFFAPTTRAPDGSLFRFNIEARVEPRPKMTEE